jgi:hypothetical protein
MGSPRAGLRPAYRRGQSRRLPVARALHGAGGAGSRRRHHRAPDSALGCRGPHAGANSATSALSPEQARAERCRSCSRRSSGRSREGPYSAAGPYSSPLVAAICTRLQSRRRKYLLFLEFSAFWQSEGQGIDPLQLHQVLFLRPRAGSRIDLAQVVCPENPAGTAGRAASPLIGASRLTEQRSADARRFGPYERGRPLLEGHISGGRRRASSAPRPQK